MSESSLMLPLPALKFSNCRRSSTIAVPSSRYFRKRAATKVLIYLASFCFPCFSVTVFAAMCLSSTCFGDTFFFYFLRLQDYYTAFESNGLLSSKMLSESNSSNLIDVFGRSVLHYAALNNRVEILAILCTNGAEINLQDEKVGEKKKSFCFHFCTFYLNRMYFVSVFIIVF